MVKNLYWGNVTVYEAYTKKGGTYFDVPVKKQLVWAKYNVLVLEFVTREQFGGSITELQIVAL